MWFGVEAAFPSWINCNLFWFLLKVRRWGGNCAFGWVTCSLFPAKLSLVLQGFLQPTLGHPVEKDNGIKCVFAFVGSHLPQNPDRLQYNYRRHLSLPACAAVTMKITSLVPAVGKKLILRLNDQPPCCLCDVHLNKLFIIVPTVWGVSAPFNHHQNAMPPMSYIWDPFCHASLYLVGKWQPFTEGEETTCLIHAQIKTIFSS